MKGGRGEYDAVRAEMTRLLCTRLLCSLSQVDLVQVTKFDSSTLFQLVPLDSEALVVRGTIHHYLSGPNIPMSSYVHIRHTTSRGYLCANTRSGAAAPLASSSLGLLRPSGNGPRADAAKASPPSPSPVDNRRDGRCRTGTEEDACAARGGSDTMMGDDGRKTEEGGGGEVGATPRSSLMGHAEHAQRATASIASGSAHSHQRSALSTTEDVLVSALATHQLPLQVCKSKRHDDVVHVTAVRMQCKCSECVAAVVVWTCC